MKNKAFALASMAMSCFALGLMLKIDRNILSWTGFPEEWLRYAALLDHALIVIGGVLLMLHWIVKTRFSKDTRHENA